MVLWLGAAWARPVRDGGVPCTASAGLATITCGDHTFNLSSMGQNYAWEQTQSGSSIYVFFFQMMGSALPSQVQDVSGHSCAVPAGSVMMQYTPTGCHDLGHQTNATITFYNDTSEYLDMVFRGGDGGWVTIQEEKEMKKENEEERKKEKKKNKNRKKKRKK